MLPYRGNLSYEKLIDATDIYNAVVDPEEWAAQVSSANRGRPIAQDAKTGEETGRRTGPGADQKTGGWEVVFSHLIDIIRDRKENRPEGSYTTYLFNSGESKIRKKTGEEAIELVLATTAEETASEAADLIYHLLVLLEELDIPFDQVIRELENRR